MTRCSISHATRLLISLLLVATFGYFGISSAAPPEPAALVRVDLSSENQLQELAPLQLTVYAQLHNSEGGVTLLLPATLSDQAALNRLGYAYQVLAADERGEQLFLLVGLPEALEKAQRITGLLYIDGRQAVARASPNQKAGLAELDIKLLPLPLRALTVPTYPTEAIAYQAGSLTAYPRVQEMINQVTSGDLYQLVGDLSGEWNTTIGGSAYRIATRYTLTDTPIKKATLYARDTLQSLGLLTDFDYYIFEYYGTNYERRNVIAQQTGLTNPSRIVLLTAHIDSISGSSWSNAPGADDNASGSAAVLLAANILSQYSFGCTLRYALFTGEEQGLYGSQTYADEVKALGENIVGVLNLDMLAYNTAGSPRTIELHTRRNNNKDLEIANLFKDSISAYNINLTPLILQDGLAFSDHKPFWDNGYPAILAIEDWNDSTPHYHTTGDRLSTLDMSYYTAFTRAAIATFAHMGCLLEGQLSGQVTDQSNGQPIPGAEIQAATSGSQPTTTTTQADGSYSLPLIPANYAVTVSANNYLPQSNQDVQISAYQVRTLNAALQPCQAVQNPSFTFSPALPSVSETVTFNATASGATPISYSWNFGDGNQALGQAVTHTYNTKGGFLVNLTADNLCAQPANTIQPVYVEAELLYLPFMGGQAAP